MNISRERTQYGSHYETWTRRRTAQEKKRNGRLSWAGASGMRGKKGKRRKRGAAAFLYCAGGGPGLPRQPPHLRKVRSNCGTE
jgi:hypothetical protein